MKHVAAFLIVVSSSYLAALGHAEESGGRGDVVTEQNLFHPNRAEVRPVPPPPKPGPLAVRPEPPPPPPPGFVLTGVMLVEGDPPVALLQEPRLTQGRSVMLRPGDELGGYRLTAVAEDRVVLNKGDQRLTVLLYDPTKPAPLGPASPARLALPAAAPPSPAPSVQPGPPGRASRPDRIERREQRRTEKAQRRQEMTPNLQDPGASGAGEDEGNQSRRGGRRGRDGVQRQGGTPATPTRPFSEMFQGAVERQPGQGAGR